MNDFWKHTKIDYNKISMTVLSPLYVENSTEIGINLTASLKCLLYVFYTPYTLCIDSEHMQNQLLNFHQN